MGGKERKKKARYRKGKGDSPEDMGTDTIWATGRKKRPCLEMDPGGSGRQRDRASGPPGVGALGVVRAGRCPSLVTGLVTESQADNGGLCLCFPVWVNDHLSPGLQGRSESRLCGHCFLFPGYFCCRPQVARGLQNASRWAAWDSLLCGTSRGPPSLWSPLCLCGPQFPQGGGLYFLFPFTVHVDSDEMVAEVVTTMTGRVHHQPRLRSLLPLFSLQFFYNAHFIREDTETPTWPASFRP